MIETTWTRWLTALWLLTLPVDSEKLPAPNLFTEVQNAAVQLQLMDWHQRSMILYRFGDVVGDMRLLRVYYRDLRGAPLVQDADEFPDCKQTDEALNFNRNFRTWLTRRRDMDLTRYDYYKEIIKETDRLYDFWDTLRDANREYYYVGTRRSALKRLRGLLGDECYYRREMPPPAPYWRFQRID